MLAVHTRASTTMRHTLQSVFVAAAIVGAVLPRASAAAPSPSPPCPSLFAQAPMVLSLDAMPAPVFAALNARFRGTAAGDEILIAPRDANWQVTDVVSPGSRLLGRRFIGAGRRGKTWFVWYERGGIAHTFRVALFGLPDGARMAQPIAHEETDLAHLCPATLALLEGGPAAGTGPYSNDW